VGKFDKPAGGRLQSLQVGWRELQSFLLPFSRNREPVNAAPLHQYARTQLPRREEQAMKRRIAKIIGRFRPVRLCAGQCAQETLVGVAHPQARLGREPVQLPQPEGGGLEAWIVEDFRLLRLRLAGLVRLPFVSVPYPDPVIPITAGEQPKPDSLIEQFEDKLRLRRMSDAQLFPIHAGSGLRFAELFEQAMAELANRHGGLP